MPSSVASTTYWAIAVSLKLVVVQPISVVIIGRLDAASFASELSDSIVRSDAVEGGIHDVLGNCCLAETGRGPADFRGHYRPAGCGQFRIRIERLDRQIGCRRGWHPRRTGQLLSR